MMKSICCFRTDDYSLAGIVFEGLTGKEPVSDLKEAVNLLRFQNPAILFSAGTKKGHFNQLSKEQYDRALHGIRAISRLFHHPNKPESEIPLPALNIMELLENALLKVAEQDAELRELREEA